MNRSKYTTKGGFTLVEVLIAIFILAVGVMSLYAMQISSVTGNGKANAMTRAASVASEVVECLMTTVDTDENPSDWLVETKNSATVSATEYQNLISELDASGDPSDNPTPYSSNTPLPYAHWSGQDDLYSTDGVDNDNDGFVDNGDEFQNSLAPIDYVKWFVQDYGTDGVDNDDDGDTDETDEQNIKKVSVYVHYRMGNTFQRDNWYRVEFLKVSSVK